MRLLLETIKPFFLKAYQTRSFVIRQKSYVLMWVQLILIPVFVVLIGINMSRPTFADRYQMIGLDMAMIGAMVAGLGLLKKGAYTSVVNLQIGAITLVTTTGYLVKLSTMQNNGYNPLVVPMLVATVFTALFGTRRVLTLITALFFILNGFGYLYVAGITSPAQLRHLQTGALFAGLGLLITFFLSYYISKITETALQSTQKELEKNMELNRTLEEKVDQRTAELQQKTIEKKNLITELQATLAEVKTLTGLLPICASCKKIRDDSGYWNSIESYISTHSQAQFSHGICPECAIKLYPNLDASKKSQNKE